MKTKIFVIHGGSTYKTKKDFLERLQNLKVSIEERIRWSDDYLTKKLGTDFEIIRPRMPLRENAKYQEWKIYFDKFVPFLSKNDILIGSSLGGIFLAKYLSENKLPKKMLSVYLIAPPFDNSLSIPGKDLVGGFKLSADLSLIEKNTKNINLLFSKDDQIVPIAHAEKYRVKLPKAKLVIFESKNGHFLVPEFPEIVKMIKGEVKINNEFGKTK
ncbi:MAG: hypothetical protein WCX88_04320 [Patescibacteria group bacterium]